MPEAYPGGVPETAATTGYPDDDEPRPSDHLAEATEQGPLDPDEPATTILG